MSLAIAGKVLGGLVFTAGSCVGAYFIYDALKNDDVSFLTYSTKLSANTTSEKLIDANNNINYQCQAGGEKFDCTVYKYENDIFGSTNHANITKFKNHKQSVSEADNNNLKAKGNIYKVIAKRLSDDTKMQKILSSSQITVVDKKGNTTGNKFAELDVKFVMDGSTISDKNKTKYFIFEGVANTTITLESGKKYECSVEKTWTECKIYNFNQTNTEKDFKKLTFSYTSSTTSVSIAEDKYYLIEWDEKEKASNIKNIQIKKSDNTGEKTYKVTSATMIGESGSEKLFIWDY